MAMNPFLMEDLTDYTSPTNGASSNPFLCGGDFAAAEPSDNPFLNAGAESSPFGASSTNPFADFGATYEPAGGNIFGVGDAAQSVDYSDIFASQPPQNDFFGSHAEPAKPEVPPTLDLMQDQNDFCPETSQIFGVSEADEPASAAPKRPPPPPRPTLPPSKETTDLIRSVTGAMEATSVHLLDRLQATRTPSPTDLRDLHTPSPPHFGDLLDAGEPRLPAFPSGVDLNLMGEDPSPVAAPAAAAPMPAPTAAPMPRPPPPRPQRPPEPQNDMFDMFGTSQPTRPPPPASNADILGLFNAPTKQEPKADLLSDDFVPEPEPAVEASPPVEPKAATPANNDFTTLNEDFVGDSYPEVNDNIVKSESFVEVTSESVSEPTASDDQDTVKERSSSISDAVKSMIPEFVTNIPETFKSDFGVPEDYTSMHDAFGKTIDDGFNSEQAEFGLGMDDSYHADQPDTYSAVTESFADTFGSNVTGSYTTINENFGTTADDGFGSSQLDTYSAMPETFGSTVSDIKSIGDTLCSGMSDTYDTNASDSFGLGHEDPISAAMMSDSSAIDAGMTHDDNFNSAMSNRYGSAIPDNYTFGTAFGTTIQETFGPGMDDGFGPPPAAPVPAQPSPKAPQRGNTIDFDDFAAKFDNIAARDDSALVIAVAEDPFDPFGNAGVADGDTGDAWGASAAGGEVTSSGGGFGADESFDAFLSMHDAAPPPLPAAPPPRFRRHESNDSDEGQKNFAVHIKPRNVDGETGPSLALALAPPPKGAAANTAFTDTSPRFNPFDKSLELSQPLPPQGEPIGALERTDSQETPPTPLFDEDVSQPLEDFPRVLYTGEGWEMHLRQPNKKKITGQRFWKKVFIKLVHQGDSPVLQLYNTKDDKDPFQELPLQACYSVSDIGAQQFDNFGKIFTVKLQYVFYKERPGVRPGQVTKAERITTKLSQFAAYAIQGDYQGCKEFGSDLKKLGLPVEHAPQISQLFKIGCQSFEDLKSFSVQVEESLFRLAVHRDRALNYKTEEVQITAVDELYVEQDAFGHVEKQIARVRLFFLGFLAGMPDVELGVNDMWRQGKEVVGRHDIIPVVTEEWIRLENVEFHACVQLDEYERTHVIKFKPPDACYLELMRFRIRPPRNRELPLQVKAVMCVTGNKVQLNCDVLVPGFSSRKFGQIPCEDIMIRFPIPECWIYLFRVEKHFRYGSVKSTHRRTGKVKGIERFLGAMETLETSLIEVTSGQAKYEHQHRAIVWRMSRLPKEGQGAYTTHNLVCRMGLTSFDQIPDKLSEYCYVEFTMPSTQASHMTVRSVSLTNQAKDDPPEKYVRQLARHEYRVGIEHTQGEGPGAYVTATIAKPTPAPVPVVDQLDQPEPIAESDSDSSN